VPGERTRGERGSVTAEFAIGLPGVIATVLLILGALLAGSTYVQCQEAARVGAREAMLHGDSTRAGAAAEKVASDKAVIAVTTEGKWVRVHVEQPVFIAAIPIRVSAHMSAPMEGGSTSEPGGRTGVSDSH